MESITIAELAAKWPEAEAALATQSSIVITRDSKAVAKLVPLENCGAQHRQRFDFEAHARRLQEDADMELGDQLQREIQRDRNDEPLS
jgi:antitoxin (DNA-binding transcriptional repressor) of toxin-antitoxin stability system